MAKKRSEKQPEIEPEMTDREPEPERKDPDWCPRCKAPALKGKDKSLNCAQCRDKF